MADALPATGVTAFLPTIASTGPAETKQQVERVAAALSGSSPTAADILGLRLEGPFISRAKKGAQDAAAIRPADAAELAALAACGPIRIVDFAPEEDLGFGLLAALVERGIVPSIGHTAATYEQTIAALEAGARHCTHLFNAMPPLEHRAPGTVGALLTDTRPTVEIIADAIHLHPATLRLVLRTRGSHAAALVTDAMSAAGLPDGLYAFLGHQVRVADGAVRMPDGTLAGSVLTLDGAVRNMVVHAGASWSDAIRMATLTPATIIGVADRKGSLKPGAQADFVVLDEDGFVRQTWRAGRLAFDSAERAPVDPTPC
jgi:N-acetylglucosamine-6-phosphate deacetylase